MILNNIPITHIKSKRKSLTLAIIPGGKVVLKTPLYTTNREILRFIQSQSQWITKKVTEAKLNHKTYNFIFGSKVPYLGKELNIIQGNHKKGVVFNKEVLLLADSSSIEKQLLAWYKEQARSEITELTDKYAKELGVLYNKIYIKNQKTRWGSCSGRGNLNFSWKIILTSRECLQYLVIHEVCHLLEMNHSKEFWKLVRKYDPDYLINQKNLQKAGYYLTTFLE